MDNDNNNERDNNKQTNEIRNESKEDDDEDRDAIKLQQTNNNTTATTTTTTTTTNLPEIEIDNATYAMREEDAEQQEDTEDDEDDSLHTVSSVKEVNPPTPASASAPPQLVTLEGTHTTATATESLESMVPSKIDKKQMSFEQIIEDLDMPAPSTSRVVENVREYVKQIESRLEDTESTSPPRATTTSPQLSAAQIVEHPPKEALRLETIKGASELSFTSQQSDESLAILSEVESIAHEEVERIVAENVAPSTSEQRVSERADFQQVERENQEIAERFKQIMEMFDSFTKNLESLEMPAISPAEEVAEKTTAIPLRRRLSFKGLRSADLSAAAGSGAGAAATSSSVGGSGSGGIYNEFYLEVHGAGRNDSDKTADKEPAAANQNLVRQAAYSTTGASAYPQKVEAAIDPMCRDIATTVSGLELLSELPPPALNLSLQPQSPCERVAMHRLSTIGCQTTGDYFTMPMPTSASTSFSNLHSAATKDYSQTDDDVVNALIIDSINDTTTTSSCAAGAPTTSFTDATETSTITVVQPRTKIHGTTDQSALVKIREPPTIIDLTEDALAPRVTSIVTGTGGGGGGGAGACQTTTDAPCERTYHTIHIEANSSPSSSEMRRPPLWSRLWNVITDFCAAVCLCLQVNKDCLLCFGFFIALVVSASFLTAFFYRTLSINPQLLQAPAAPSNIANHVNALHSIRNENSLYGL